MKFLNFPSFSYDISLDYPILSKLLKLGIICIKEVKASFPRILQPRKVYDLSQRHNNTSHTTYITVNQNDCSFAVF